MHCEWGVGICGVRAVSCSARNELTELFSPRWVAALHLAASEGMLMVVQYLIKNKASVNVRDRWGSTPLQDAVLANHKLVANLLYTHGGKMLLDDEAGTICSCAAEGATGKMSLLMECGLDINSGDYDQRTAIHLACAEKQTLSIYHLLNTCMADVNVVDRWGATPLEDALATGRKDNALIVMAAGGRRPLRKGSKALSPAPSAEDAAAPASDANESASQEDLEAKKDNLYRELRQMQDETAMAGIRASIKNLEEKVPCPVRAHPHWQLDRNPAVLGLVLIGSLRIVVRGWTGPSSCDQVKAQVVYPDMLDLHTQQLFHHKTSMLILDELMDIQAHCNLVPRYMKRLNTGLQVCSTLIMQVTGTKNTVKLQRRRKRGQAPSYISSPSKKHSGNLDVTTPDQQPQRLLPVFNKAMLSLNHLKGTIAQFQKVFHDTLCQLEKPRQKVAAAWDENTQIAKTSTDAMLPVAHNGLPALRGKVGNGHLLRAEASTESVNESPHHGQESASYTQLVAILQALHCPYESTGVYHKILDEIRGYHERSEHHTGEEEIDGLSVEGLLLSHTFRKQLAPMVFCLLDGDEEVRPEKESKESLAASFVSDRWMENGRPGEEERVRLSVSGARGCGGESPWESVGESPKAQHSPKHSERLSEDGPSLTKQLLGMMKTIRAVFFMFDLDRSGVVDSDEVLEWWNALKDIKGNAIEILLGCSSLEEDESPDAINFEVFTHRVFNLLNDELDELPEDEMADMQLDIVESPEPNTREMLEISDYVEEEEAGDMEEGSYSDLEGTEKNKGTEENKVQTKMSRWIAIKTTLIGLVLDITLQQAKEKTKADLDGNGEVEKSKLEAACQDMDPMIAQHVERMFEVMEGGDLENITLNQFRGAHRKCLTNRKGMNGMLAGFTRSAGMDRFVISPNTPFHKWWDIFMRLCYVFFFVEVPVRIAFDTFERLGWAYFIVCQTIDSMLLINIVLNFFTAYKNKKSVMVYELSKIRKHYFGTTFPIDIFCAFPADMFLFICTTILVHPLLATVGALPSPSPSPPFSPAVPHAMPPDAPACGRQQQTHVAGDDATRNIVPSPPNGFLVAFLLLSLRVVGTPTAYTLMSWLRLTKLGTVRHLWGLISGKSTTASNTASSLCVCPIPQRIRPSAPFAPSPSASKDGFGAPHVDPMAG
ncbi:hypothetical protein CYMTET_24986 [Cymbomonas tetramitiformis]|uniref:EF-hand domain-containing protein n=1 Tax=Cymbomonas tetramitiformis TaxID=36881 RepID=A0AAE0FUZ7_9CHLO|nr:hypothetical protein CYMTET_24986 [Cymbomonas tetramitiformis]